MNQRVAVIGTGRMGSALAAALLNKGFVTTVWNRTAAKTEPLSRIGGRVAKDTLEAVGQAEVVIVNINNYDSTMQLLQRPEIESALRGKILVQLSSGTPDEARQMQSWARPLGIEYLDGAILSYPEGIGKPEAAVLYSGSEQTLPAREASPACIRRQPNVCRRRNRPRFGARYCRSYLGHECDDGLSAGVHCLRSRKHARREIHATG
jgi:3-hydroxyisobutyrate dehydrogenase-like beta-hydroxyacid dehydrogenase